MRGELHSEAACLGCRLTSRRRSFAQYTVYSIYVDKWDFAIGRTGVASLLGPAFRFVVNAW